MTVNGGAQLEFMLPEKEPEHRPVLELTPQQMLRRLGPTPLVAVGLVVVAFVLGLILSPHLRQSVARSAGFSLDLGDPPAVEPFLLQNVSKSEAKRVNDATPFTTAPVIAAKPFMFAGSALDMEKATDCLAATIFYEAGNETVQGQMAVVQVVLNRARHPAFPKTVCGVVFQGHERRTGCQFSYTCDGSMVRRPADAAWARFRALSRAMLNGLVYTPVGLATHYHTDWVLPKWSARLDKVRAEGTHLFFRYADGWGTPKAFKAKPMLAEPAFAKMALLSASHRTPGVDLDAVMADLKAAAGLEEAGLPIPPIASGTDPFLANATPIPANVSATLTPEDTSKDTFLITVDPLLEGAALSTMAERACGARTYCKVLAWADPDLMPKGLPIEPQARASMAFSYIRMKKGAGEAKWNCGLYPQDRPGRCLPGSQVKGIATNSGGASLGGTGLTPEKSGNAPGGKAQ